MPDESISGTRRRTALITGGTRNIGRAAALALAGDGIQVVVVSRHLDADAQTTLDALAQCGSEGIHIAADVSDEMAVQQMFAAAAEYFGGIDIMVHCAAVRRVRPIADMSLAEWREVMAINLDAAFLCSKAVLPHFPAHGGRIVYFSGVSAFFGVADRAHVIASKAGVVGLARALATELGARGITVNCISPGTIETARGPNAGALPHAVNELPIPLERRGTVDEVAAVLRMLVSDGGAYVTGQVIHVNGGLYFG
jgi:3-oxoacyl-[acyl-carrier protein] reductase